MKRSFFITTPVIACCLIALWIAVLLPDHCFSSAATTPIGTVREIRSGILERQERDLWKPLTAGMEITSNDRIRTGADGLAVLALNDIGTILIGANTEYYLGGPAREFKTLLKRGYIWISAKLSPGRTMSVTTASAVSGVRGTKFSVIQDAQGMNVCTCKGEVQVTLKDGTSMNVTSGMYSMIDGKGKSGKPESGKPHLDKIWKEKPARYAACVMCHKKGQKIVDLN